MDIVCPDCGKVATLSVDLRGCTQCGRVIRTESGMLDLSRTDERQGERRFYDGEYSRTQKNIEKKEHIESVASKWHAPDAPENALVLEKAGSLTGKTVLLLGNGESVKELHFLTMRPECLVYSDLSMHALVNISERFDLDEHRGRLLFASIDAHNIPFVDETFDVIYGFAMVHHLPDLDRFFSSVSAALKPGGYAVFMDDAFAPIWHYSKQTWLKPLMRRSHRTTGISLEDYRFSMTGGFKEQDLVGLLERIGVESYFARTSLLTYLVYRAGEKLLPRKLNRMLHWKPIASAIGMVDRAVCRANVLRRNQIRLVWGFRKPLGLADRQLAAR